MIMFLLAYLDSISLVAFVCLFSIVTMVNNSYSKHSTKAVLANEKDTRTGHSSAGGLKAKFIAGI